MTNKMKNNFNIEDKPGKDSNNDLTAEGTDDFFDLRMAMGKSISAPPPGLSEPFPSQGGMPQAEPEVDATTTKEYYDYYYSLKPLDPRLPKPKWKPNLYGVSNFGPLHPIQEDHRDLKGHPIPSTSDKLNDNEDLGDQFDRSVQLDNRGFSQQQTSTGNNNYPIQNQNQSRKFNQTSHFEDEQSQNQRQTNQNQHQSHHQHHNQHQQRHNQGFHGERKGQGYTGGQTVQGAHQGQSQQQFRPHQGKYQPQGFPGQGQYNQNTGFQGGQIYPQDQQMAGLYEPNYMNPQMSAQPYFGMNVYQAQMYPYGMDPNMTGGANTFNKYPQGPYNPAGRMNPMPNMGQFYPGNNPYNMQQYYYPMGLTPMQTMQPMQPIQPTVQSNFQAPGYVNQQQQQKPHKTFNKMNPNNSANNLQKQDMKNILSRLLENCRDQNGSRLIQQYFEKASEEEKEQMFLQIIPHAFSLMTDVFGNYVIQKILELGNDEQKTEIYDTMEGRIFELCQNTYGCRVVQRALEKTNDEMQDKVLNEISSHVLDLIEDQNGNHVIQKCFENTPPEKLQFIIDEVSDNIDRLAFHAFGCRVIQRILEYCPAEMTKSMLKKLMGYALKCCECQYGNYIMQHILEKGPNEEKEQLLRLLRDNFVYLSMNKFASNVTERSAIHGTPEFKKDVVRVLTTTYYEDKLGLVALMTHPFGNYVVQRLFECGDTQVKRAIHDAAQGQNLEDIKKTSYGKHVIGFIEKLMEGKRN